MKALLTAFEPFGGETVNPAQEALRQLPPCISGVALVKVTVPTVFGASIATVADAIRRERPDFVLCIGQAGGRAALTPERVAINLDDAAIADNAGNRPVDTPIYKDGPPAYFATLPVKAMVEAMQSAGIPAAVSNSAGTFVCNHLMYGVLHILSRELPHARGGFLHVPFIPAQTEANHPSAPSVPLPTIVRGIELCVQAIAAHGKNG